MRESDPPLRNCARQVVHFEPETALLLPGLGELLLPLLCGEALLQLSDRVVDRRCFLEPGADAS